ncbi:MAG: hypothetical protein HYT80_09680, partial [Euryarchaeota archaeon]|nr:hypothetical protein [Euryarchaeota archaeon]
MNPETPTFFFDTYALIERQRGAAAYERFADEPVFTHQNNLLEFAYAVARDHGEGTARDQVASLNANLVSADV